MFALAASCSPDENVASISGGGQCWRKCMQRLAAPCARRPDKRRRAVVVDLRLYFPAPGTDATAETEASRGLCKVEAGDEHITIRLTKLRGEFQSLRPAQAGGPLWSCRRGYATKLPGTGKLAIKTTHREPPQRRPRRLRPLGQRTSRQTRVGGTHLDGCEFFRRLECIQPPPPPPPPRAAGHRRRNSAPWRRARR